MARGAHRHHIALLLNSHLKQIGAFGVHHCADGGGKVFAVDNCLTRNAIGFGNLHKIGVRHWGERIAAVEEHCLPLANIAQIVVVEQDKFYGNLILHYGAKFLNGHLQAAVAKEHAHIAVGGAESRSNASRRAEAHCAHTARRHHAAVFGELEVASCHHLILTNVGNHNCLITSLSGNRIHNLAHLYRAIGGVNLLLDYNCPLLLLIGVETLNPIGV